MKIKNILKNTLKYHYLMVLPEKSLLLSSNNSDKEAREKLFSKVSSKGDTIVNKPVYRIKLSKNKEGILATVTKFIFKKVNKIKKKDDDKQNEVIFSKKYLKLNTQNEKINPDNIRKVAFAYDKDILSNFVLSINYYSKIVGDINKYYSN